MKRLEGWALTVFWLGMLALLLRYLGVDFPATWDAFRAWPEWQQFAFVLYWLIVLPWGWQAINQGGSSAPVQDRPTKR